MVGSHYEILGIEPDATESDIRKAYKQKAKHLHPDINKSATAAEEFVLLKEAFETLIDVNKRFLYDRGNHVSDGFRNVGQYVKGARQFRYMPSYEEWVETKKQKLKKDRQDEQMRWSRERDQIQASPHFFWLKVGFFAQIISLYAFAIIIFATAAYIIIKTHFVFTFVILPFLCAAAFLLLWAYNRYQRRVYLYR